MKNSYTLIVQFTGTELSGKYIRLGSVLSQQKFEVTDVRALGMSQLSDRPCYSSQVLDRPCYSSQASNRPCCNSQISVTTPCYSSILFRKQQENTSQRREGMPTKRLEERREPWPFGSSFYVFFPPPGPALCKLGQPGVLFVLPEVLTPVLGPSFDLLLSVFPSFSFSHCHSELLFPILTT